MLKFSRSAVLLPKAEEAVDRAFAAKINRLLGPLATLHAIKRTEALAGNGVFVPDENERAAILEQAEAQSLELVALDNERRRIKATLRSAKSAQEIKDILVSEGVEVPASS